MRQGPQRQAQLEQRLAQSVVIDPEKQAEVASVGQALGVTLRDSRALLEVLSRGPVLSGASLGRRTQAASQKAGALLAVLDEVARQRVREVAADEIYVKDPVLMVVEPDSLCWLSGQLADTVSGAAWHEQLEHWPNLEQVTRDGGTAWQKGVASVNAQRQQQGQPLVVDQGDHFHALREGRVGLRKAEARARQVLTAAEAAEHELAASSRQGHKQSGAAVRASWAWKKAEQALDAWQERERVWCQTKESLRLMTPTGALNSRVQAAAALAETLPQLPDGDFAKLQRQLGKPEMLNYLDRVQHQIAALPFPEAVKQAAVRQEGMRRRPEALQGESPQAAARRGILLVCAVGLSQAGTVGHEAVAAVPDLFRRAYRASSLVECLNSVLSRHAGHRQRTQGRLDLKRLYWNCHRFRSGRRRRTTPYERLGLLLPEGLHWWDMLKLTSEQLRDKLSTAKTAA